MTHATARPTAPKGAATHHARMITSRVNASAIPTHVSLARASAIDTTATRRQEPKPARTPDVTAMATYPTAPTSTGASSAAPCSSNTRLTHTGAEVTRRTRVP